ncbi:MAG TPA: MBL fold metallo-hydrolase [bacterium]|nr:MBL fold metallo-hydrolase [bacterium]HQG45818.1 MBL fold metallo-hydrolase [bacterium]HQI47858.1 MBL fold metallo-hydrolase [bacterium]HQJ64308.1 MBL fold metallo-hydrolase [bacterium]
MEIQFFGGVQSVTGTMHVLTIRGQKILLDCGLYQGKRDESFQRNRELPFDARSINAMVLSHAHIDHSGNIPQLVKLGYSGPVYCTHATRDLCSIMLQDAGHIQEKDVEFVNKKRVRSGMKPVMPLYTAHDALKAMNQFISVGYERTMPIADGVSVTFFDAGHILGSAITRLDINDDGKPLTLIFSGDLGRPGMPILRDPTIFQEADILFTESTYGGRFHDDYSTVNQKLAQAVNDTIQRGGKIIIPAFSVGRTQEIVFALHQLTLAGEIPEIPVFVDSPLSVNATAVFRAHPECYDEETAELLERTDDVFGFRKLHYVETVEESKKLNDLRQPSIIISASGMCEAGRILHHLRNNIEDERNTILIVGFMAENTLGRRLVEQEPSVRIFGEEFRLAAQVVKLNAFSAHADHRELIQWISHFDREKLDHLFILHGELTGSEALAQGLASLGLKEVRIPERGESVEVHA